MVTGATLLLIIALAYATTTDLRARRIPNGLTLPMLGGGLVLRAVGEGYDGLLIGVEGAGLALAMLIVPFTFNWIGAGDVKLAIAVGALMGPNFVFIALLFAAVIAGAIAFADILRQRQLAMTAQYLLLVAWRLPAVEGLALKGRLPYAPAMAGGSLAALAIVALGI